MSLTVSGLYYMVLFTDSWNGLDNHTHQKNPFSFQRKKQTWSLQEKDMVNIFHFILSNLAVEKIYNFCTLWIETGIILVWIQNVSFVLLGVWAFFEHADGSTIPVWKKDAGYHLKHIFS